MRSARRRRSIFCDVVEYEYVENYEEEWAEEFQEEQVEEYAKEFEKYIEQYDGEKWGVWIGIVGEYEED